MSLGLDWLRILPREDSSHPPFRSVYRDFGAYCKNKNESLGENSEQLLVPKNEILRSIRRLAAQLDRDSAKFWQQDLVSSLHAHRNKLSCDGPASRADSDNRTLVNLRYHRVNCAYVRK